MKYLFIIVVLLFGGVKSLYTQCESFYYTLSPDEIVNVDINQINRIDSTGFKHTIYIDTTYDHSYFVFNLQSPEFYIEVINEKKSGFTYYVVNDKTKKRFNLGPLEYDFKNYRADIASTSNFIYTQNEKKTILFEYNKNEVKYPKHPLFDILGYDMEYVFLLLKEKFIFKNNIYYPGSIFRFNGAELQLVTARIDTSGFAEVNDIIFLNTDYRIENTFLNKEYIDCKNITQFSSKVYYKNKLVDSSTFKSEYAITESCAYMNDTLFLWRKFESREFINGESTVRLNISDTLKQEPVIKEFVARYINLQVFYAYYNNYLIALMHLDPRDEKGFIPGTKTTDNGIVLNDKCRRYDLVLLFDKRDLTFLGYPEIVFGNW
ncbi:MAG: hypothetical protein KBD42_14735 [Chitinophagales bacterium]|nr:hypothetical protein [Chitinophagales bacterium]MBP9797302.1 hypothetical protein [Chitinophagales bacterium]